jgi:transcriptional regulator with XRE-family HTH domain
MRTSEHETKVTALHRPRRKQLEKHLRVRRADTRDAEVGRRVRSRRLEQKLSQTELADKIGVTFQQVQKYEKGTNRIGAGRLQRIGEALEVPITFFFGTENGAEQTPSGKNSNAGVPALESMFGMLQTNGSIRLVKAFHKIRSTKMRNILVQLVEEAAEADLARGDDAT